MLRFPAIAAGLLPDVEPVERPLDPVPEATALEEVETKMGVELISSLEGTRICSNCGSLLF